MERVHGLPKVANSPHVSEAQDEHGDDVAEDEGADVHDLALGDLPDGVADSQVGQLELLVVAEVRAREDEGEPPDETNGQEGVPGCPQLPGVQGVSYGQIPAREREREMAAVLGRAWRERCQEQTGERAEMMDLNFPGQLVSHTTDSLVLLRDPVQHKGLRKILSPTLFITLCSQQWLWGQWG